MSEPAEKSSETSEAAQNKDNANSIEEVDQLMSLNKEKVNVAACKTDFGRFSCSNRTGFEIYASFRNCNSHF